MEEYKINAANIAFQGNWTLFTKRKRNERGHGQIL